MKKSETQTVLQAYSSPKCCSITLTVKGDVLQNASSGTGGGEIGGDGDAFEE